MEACINQSFVREVTAGSILLVAIRWDGSAGGIVSMGDTSGNTYTESADCEEWDALWKKTGYSAFDARKRYYALSGKSGQNTAIVRFSIPGNDVEMRVAEVARLSPAIA
jgi:hypothetical protein